MVYRLYGYLIGTDVCGADLDRWEVADLGLNPPFRLEESAPSGYQDITSIYNLDAFGFGINKDYIFVRDLIKREVAQVAYDTTISTENDPEDIIDPQVEDKYRVGINPTGLFTDHANEIAVFNGSGWDFYRASIFGFNLLSPNEKIICCTHKIGAHDDRVAVVGLNNVINFGLLYHSNSIKGRQTRATYAIAEVHNRLPNHANEVLYEVISNKSDLLKTFINYGIEGTQYDSSFETPISNPNGIMDYIYGTADFTGGGLINSGYTPEGCTLQQLCDKLRDYFIYGIY